MPNLSDRLKPSYDMFSTCYPIQETCVYCGRKYAPINFLPSGDKYTLCCHHVIDKPIEVCGYVTLMDLEDCEWDTEL